MNIRTGFSAAVCLFVAGGCGGGGGSDGATASVRVHVTDYFGQPVGGAAVDLCGKARCYGQAYSDEEGNAAFENVSAGPARLCAFYPARGGGGCQDVTISAGGTVALDQQLQLNPYDPGNAAVLDASVDENGLSPDGRTLDITIRVAVTDRRGVGSWFDAYPVRVDDCIAREAQELIDAGPRCIRGANGSDASYTFGGLIGPPVAHTIRQPVEPATVALLLDQSEAFFEYEEDIREARLFTGKLFADRMLPETILLLAAFAGDDPAGDYVSVLPQTPVTFLPANNPGPFLSKVETFEQLDGLAGAGGGIAPLYAAILSSIEFVATHAMPGTRRMLVVMANGRDDACRAPAQCAALRDEIAVQARARNVELILQSGYYYGYNLHGDDYPEYEALRALAVDTSAPLIVGDYLSHRALDVVRQLVVGEVAVEDLRVRLTSDVPGAFHPGAIVVGELHGSTESNCPWDCQDYSFPFAVRVP